MYRALLSIAFVSILASSAFAQAPKKPNIIFILADDLGYGDLGCYGQKKIKTPNLDRLATQGMRFTQAYAGSTVCAPSRCVLMTGKHTGHAHIRGNALVPLRPVDITIATLLKRAGYFTGLIGKWGLGEPGSTGIPTKQGFDYFFGYLNQHLAHNYYPDHLWRNQEKVPIEGNVVEKNVATKRAQYSHDLFAEEALRFVEQNKTKPFFLYLAFTIPHANNEAGKLGMEVPSDEPYSKEDWPQAQRNHAAMITRMDRDIGRLLQKLQELGLDENTIVFFTSDNGPHQEGGGNPFFFRSSGPLRGFKRSLHEGGVRVPMIVRWPGRIPAGETNPHVWAFWDFLPTAAELAGAKTPNDLDGISVVPTLLRKGKQRTHDFLYWEFHEGRSQQAVRMGDWKAIRSKLGGPLELYDLAKDLGEDKNIADKHPDVIARIEAYLQTARTDSPQWPLKGEAKKKAAAPRIEEQKSNVHLRGDFTNARLQFETKKTGHVAFIGGSITEMNGYRPLVCDFLTKRFPETKLTFTDAGIASTCSTTGAFRLAKDVLAKGPVDLFFIEFAVNDDQDAGHARRECIRGMEGILRQAFAHNPNMDVVITYFVNPSMLQTIQDGKTSLTIGSHEEVARHYQVSTVNLAQEVADRIREGTMTWKQYGGVHPGPPGNELCASLIAELLNTAWKAPLAKNAASAPHKLPDQPVDAGNYGNGRFIDPSKAVLGKGWTLETPDWKNLPGTCRDRFRAIPLLCASEPGASLTLEFDGKAVGAYLLAGPDAGAVSVSIDGGPFTKMDLFHRFSRGLHYPRTVLFASDLQPGAHKLTLRIANERPKDSSGTALRIIQFVAN